MASKTQISRVQKLQNFEARVAHGGVSKYDHITPVLNKLKWLKVDEKITYDILVLVYKILNNHLPPWLFDFNYNRDVRIATTRQNSHLHVPRTSTNIGSQSFTVKGPDTWNRLSPSIRNKPNLSGFKNALQNDFLTRRI